MRGLRSHGPIGFSIYRWSRAMKATTLMLLTADGDVKCVCNCLNGDVAGGGALCRYSQDCDAREIRRECATNHRQIGKSQRATTSRTTLRIYVFKQAIPLVANISRLRFCKIETRKGQGCPAFSRPFADDMRQPSSRKCPKTPSDLLQKHLRDRDGKRA